MGAVTRTREPSDRAATGPAPFAPADVRPAAVRRSGRAEAALKGCRAVACCMLSRLEAGGEADGEGGIEEARARRPGR